MLLLVHKLTKESVHVVFEHNIKSFDCNILKFVCNMNIIATDNLPMFILVFLSAA